MVTNFINKVVLYVCIKTFHSLKVFPASHYQPLVFPFEKSGLMWRQLPSIYFGSDIFFIRFFDGERFVEELLSLIGLDGDTTGESVYNALVSKLDELGIPLDRCMSVTTYGAPAMVGTHQGILARLRKDNSLY